MCTLKDTFTLQNSPIKRDLYKISLVGFCTIHDSFSLKTDSLWNFAKCWARLKKVLLLKRH